MSTAVFTNKGVALLAKLAKGNTLDITGAKTGAGMVDSTTLRDQTDVTTPMQSFDIQGINDLGNGECDLILSLTNKGLTDGYAVSQIGIFARDPDEGEVLYSIYQDDSKDKTNIPSESKRPGYNAEWTYRIKYDQADSVNVTVDPANAVSMAVMENYVGAQLKRFVPITRTVNGKALDKDIVLTAADVGAVTAGEVDGAMTAANVKKKFDSADIITTTGTGAAYVATVPGITELKTGVSFTMIPHTASTTNQPTLNVNGWGAKNIRQPLTTNTGATTTADLDTWLTAEKPVRVRYDGAQWEIDIPRPSATALYGTVPVEHGGIGRDTVTPGSFLVGNGTEAMQEKTPAEVLALINGISMKTATATLTTAGWSDNKQTVDVSGVTASNTVFVTHAPSGYTTYRDYGVRLASQEDGKLTFECDEIPDADITVNVAIFE